MILKLCRHPGCIALTDRRDSLCVKHVRQKWREQSAKMPTSHARGYDGQWRKVRARKLAMNPMCERCEKDGRVTLAYLVHHKDRNTRNNRDDNLMALCTHCHTQEHNGEGFGRREWKGSNQTEIDE